MRSGRETVTPEFQSLRVSEFQSFTPRTHHETEPAALIYFIANHRAGMVKIGTAVDVGKRLASLQCGSPDPLELMGSFPGGLNEEARLHARFGPLRARGEWFRSSSDLDRAIGDLSMCGHASKRPYSLTAGVERWASGQIGFPVETYRIAHSYQAMPGPAWVAGAMPAAVFWWWHVFANRQRFDTANEATTWFVVAWFKWLRNSKSPQFTPAWSTK